MGCSRPLGIAVLIGVLAVISVGAVTPSAAHAQTPGHITGQVTADIDRGSVSAELCISRFPAHRDSIHFVLHRGFNVKRIRASDGAPVQYAATAIPGGHALRYAVAAPTSQDGAATAPPLHGICAEYTGAFPVYNVAAGDHRASDGSDVIAFNGNTLRARGEALWHPAPYDVRTGETHGAMTYDVRVNCTTCEQIYLNGAPPQPGPVARFESDVARELVIIAGSFAVQERDGVRLMGDAVALDTAAMFVAQIARIRAFYEEFIGLPYGGTIDYMRVVPVRVDRPFQLWGFFSDPLLGVAGLSMGLMVQVLNDEKHPARAPLLGFLSHELAHRYFSGPLRGPHTQLFSEPFANYVSLKAIRNLHGQVAYDAAIAELHESVLTGPQLPRLDDADARAFADDDYRYRYAPLMLLSLERRIGETGMKRLMRTLLTAPPAEQATADYALLRRSAVRSGVTEDAWSRWENECMRPAVAENACLKSLIRR